MIRIRIAICDDNEAVVHSVRNAVLEFKYIDSDLRIEEFYSGEALLNAYSQGNYYDVIFLDIQMDHINGIETAERIKDIQKDVILIFLTGHSNYVKDAFRVQAFQYLIKPVKKDEIMKELNRALEEYRVNRAKYKIVNNNQTAFLEIQNIKYMEVRGHFITIHTDGAEYLVKGKLQEEEHKLKSYDFIRCHQGYLVNMSWIKTIEEDVILLKDGLRIPISRRLKKDAIESFSNYIIDKCI